MLYFAAFTLGFIFTWFLCEACPSLEERWFLFEGRIVDLVSGRPPEEQG